jgi:hypothetical protein
MAIEHSVIIAAARYVSIGEHVRSRALDALRFSLTQSGLERSRHQADGHYYHT